MNKIQPLLTAPTGRQTHQFRRDEVEEQPVHQQGHVQERGHRRPGSSEERRRILQTR